MVTRNSRGPQVVPPRFLTPVGDHVLGEAAYPGSRSWATRPENRVRQLPIGRDVVAYPGDILTTNPSTRTVTGDDPTTTAVETTYTGRGQTYLAHPTSVKVGAADTAEWNWGDVSGGGFQALNYVDATNQLDGHLDVSVYGAPALIDVLLSDGDRVGDKVGVDLRTSTSTARADRTAAVLWNHNRVSGTGKDDTLFMRVRAMTSTHLADADIKKAFLGTVVSISRANSSSNVNGSREKLEADHNDPGIVQLGMGVGL